MFLEISSSCNNSMLFTFLGVVKALLNILHIIVPLLLILSLTFTITKLVQDPDEKKAPKKIVNSVIATVVIFFLPTIINVVIDLVAGESNQKNAIYTRQQLIDWIGNSRKRLVIYTKNKQ